jgi:hypothetical protein
MGETERDWRGKDMLGRKDADGEGRDGAKDGARDGEEFK